MLTRDFQAKRNGTEAAQAIETYREGRKSWVDFCLFPDMLEPVRMPSMFPVPTHVFKRQVISTVGLVAGENGYNVRMLWTPASQIPFTNGGTGNVQVPVLSYRKVNSSATGYASLDTANDDSTNAGTPASTGNYTAIQQTYIPSISNDVAHGGIRLIGAFIELEYIGTTDQHSGTIEVGFKPLSSDTYLTTTADRFATDAEIIQMPFYRRYKPYDGARCIWFPIDNADFMFQPAGLADNTVTATTQPFKPISVQWCININGLQVGQPVRVHCCNVYESIPDEASQDIFCPKKADSSINLEGAKQALNAVVSQGAATTPSKSADNFTGIYDTIKGMASSAMSAFNGYNQLFSSGSPLGTMLSLGTSYMMKK